MSTVALQTALSLLLRLPSERRAHELDALVAPLGLSVFEKRILANLAKERELSKFADSLADMRWSIIDVRITLLKKFVPEELLRDIYQYDFEPHSLQWDNRALPYAFLQFLASDPELRKDLIQLGQPAIWDVIAFEKAQNKLFFDQFLMRDGRAPVASCLAHRQYEVLSLAFDLPALFQSQAFHENAVTAVQMQQWQSPIHLLLVGEDSERGFRLFEIDSETYEFLQQLHVDPLANPIRPRSYRDLVASGLCREEVVA